MRRRINKRKKNKLKFFFTALLFLVVVVYVVLFFYELSFLKTPTVISPLGKKNIYRAENIESLLYKEDIPFSSVQIASDSSILVNLAEDGQVIISSKKDIATQISSLQLMLKRLTIEGKRLKSLDFRFDKPIIVFK